MKNVSNYSLRKSHFQEKCIIWVCIFISFACGTSYGVECFPYVHFSFVSIYFYHLYFGIHFIPLVFTTTFNVYMLCCVDRKMNTSIEKQTFWQRRKTIHIIEIKYSKNAMAFRRSYQNSNQILLYTKI